MCAHRKQENYQTCETESKLCVNYVDISKMVFACGQIALDFETQCRLKHTFMSQKLHI